MNKIFLVFGLLAFGHGANASDTLNVYVNAYNCKYCNLINSQIINKYSNSDLEIILLTNAKNKKELEYYTKLKYPKTLFSQGDGLPNFTVVKEDISIAFQTIENLDHFLNFSWQPVDAFFPATVTGYRSNDSLSFLARNGQQEDFYQAKYIGASTIVDDLPRLRTALDSLKTFYNIAAYKQVFDILSME